MVIFCFITTIFASALSHFLRPTQELLFFPPQKLSNIIPNAFMDWHTDNSIIPITPDPSALSLIKTIYSDTLSKTYINSNGERIMLSLAYGRSQNDSMRLHQPEGCYAGQGFAVTQPFSTSLKINNLQLPVRRLIATQQMRNEPITYWMIVGGEVALSQFDAKIIQLKYGAKGYITDGLLFRVSSISKDNEHEFNLQSTFIGDLLKSIDKNTFKSLTGENL